MDPATMAAMSGAAGGIAGGLIQGGFAKDQAKKQMEFQERMSSTAYQRSVADMTKAGLNPALMFGSGSAASTPGGAMAEMENPGIHIQQGIQTGLQAKQVGAQTSNLAADTENKKTQQSILANETKLQGGAIQQQAMTNKVLAETLNSQIKKAKAEGDYSELNQIMGIINQGAGAAGQFISPIKIRGPK